MMPTDEGAMQRRRAVAGQRCGFCGEEYRYHTERDAILCAANLAAQTSEINARGLAP